jgi:hypothetical protein
MRSLLSAFLGVGIASGALLGCGTFSLPRVAARGTTIMIPVPDGFGAGFGRALNDALPVGPAVDPGEIDVPLASNPFLDDLQRGELLFALREGSTDGSPLHTYLPVRYATRVHAEESSRRVLPAEGDSFYPIGTPAEVGQTVAFVDIPSETDPGTYYVFVERWKRNEVPQPTNRFAQLAPVMFGSTPWLSWAGFNYSFSQPNVGMKLHVVDSGHGELFHEATHGFDKWFVDGSYSAGIYGQDLDLLIPSPKLRIWLGNPNSPNYPAAFELTLQYPAGKLEITGATLGNLHRSGALVGLTKTESPEDCAGPGSAHISLVDPERRTQWIEVAYRLRDFEQCGRAGPDDFEVVPESLKAYDLDGTAITAVAYPDPVYSY